MKIVAIEPMGMSQTRIEDFKHNLSMMGHQFTGFPDRKEDPETLKQRIENADIVMVSNIPLNREILSSDLQLKFLAVAFTGTDHIDMDYCSEKGIEVQNAAGYANVAVSELVLGLIIDLYRKITSLDSSIRNGGTRNQFLGRQIKGKTVGIIGTGAIGQQTAFNLQALGARIVAYNRSVNRELTERGISYVSLEDLLRESDIVSLHLPLTSETENLISAEKLDLFKKSAILINTARGKLVDTFALSKALQEGKIAGAAIDVFETEPPLPADHPLLKAPNCILSPHIGYATHEAIELRTEIIMGKVVDWLKNHS